MKRFDISKAKTLRGEIIKNLYDLYDEPIPLNRIMDLMRYKTFYDKRDIKRAIGYLSGIKKEFVQVEADDKEYWASFVQLTPKGVNLAEGDISDMGVVFSE